MKRKFRGMGKGVASEKGQSAWLGLGFRVIGRVRVRVRVRARVRFRFRLRVTSRWEIQSNAKGLVLRKCVHL